LNRWSFNDPPGKPEIYNWDTLPFHADVSKGIPIMADSIAPEYKRFITEQRKGNKLRQSRAQLEEGELFPQVLIDPEHATEFLRVAAKRAVGLFRPSEHTEAVWVQGDRELAVNLIGMDLRLADGLMRVRIPVRCDQTGDVIIEVFFVVGTPEQPTGLYASTYRRPNGPRLIVDAWGETLVAFAWQCVLGMITGIAGSTGKDTRGNVLVPVELTASRDGIQILPMARYRFSKSSKLGPIIERQGK
jgi:hypothetical protein